VAFGEFFWLPHCPPVREDEVARLAALEGLQAIAGKALEVADAFAEDTKRWIATEVGTDEVGPKHPYRAGDFVVIVRADHPHAGACGRLQRHAPFLGMWVLELDSHLECTALEEEIRWGTTRTSGGDVS
jgi:hypothetical protein